VTLRPAVLEAEIATIDVPYVCQSFGDCVNNRVIWPRSSEQQANYVRATRLLSRGWQRQDRDTQAYGKKDRAYRYHLTYLSLACHVAGARMTPNAKAERLARRRHEVAPLDSPLERRVRRPLAKHNLLDWTGKRIGPRRPLESRY